MQTEDSNPFMHTLALLMGIGALEALLLRIAGPPSGHLHVLAELTSPMAEPLEGILAALALAAQALAAYLVLSLALRTLTHLPGLVGQVAHHAEQALTIPAVRRGLDALLGGALIAHLALTPVSSGTGISAPQAPPPAVAMTVVAHGQDSRWDPARSRAPRSEATRAPASPVRAPSIPLPIWLGGDPRPSDPPSQSPPPGPTAPQGSIDATGAATQPAPGAGSDDASPASIADDSSRPEARMATVRHRIEPGDTLWTISAAHLPAGAGAESDIAGYWRRIYGANRRALGSDPSLIHPGVTLSIPLYDVPASAPLPPQSTPHAATSAWPRPGGPADNPPDRRP